MLSTRRKVEINLVDDNMLEGCTRRGTRFNKKVQFNIENNAINPINSAVNAEANISMESNREDKIAEFLQCNKMSNNFENNTQNDYGLFTDNYPLEVSINREISKKEFSSQNLLISEENQDILGNIEEKNNEMSPEKLNQNSNVDRYDDTHPNDEEVNVLKRLLDEKDIKYKMEKSWAIAKERLKAKHTQENILAQFKNEINNYIRVIEQEKQRNEILKNHIKALQRYIATISSTEENKSYVQTTICATNHYKTSDLNYERSSV